MKIQLPSTQSLRTFEAVSRYLNCVQAGLELSLTSSAVSKQVQALEDTLGVELFIRGKHGLLLTEAGQVYQEVVRSILRQLEEGGERVVRLRHHLQDLDVRVPVALAERWLLPRFAQFADANPGLKVHFDTTAVQDETLPRPYDAYVRYGAGYWPGCVSEYLVGRQVIMVASPDLLRRSRPIQSPTDLAGFALFGHSWDPEAWTLAFRNLGVPPGSQPPVKKWDFFSITIRSACLGHGLALVPRSLVTEELSSDKLVQVLGYGHDSPFGYYFVFSEDRRDDAALARFRDWLRSRQGEGEELAHGARPGG